jgi:hypothetical protein
MRILAILIGLLLAYTLFYVGLSKLNTGLTVSETA